MFIFSTKPLSSIFVAIERPKHAKQNGLKLDIYVLSVSACQARFGGMVDSPTQKNGPYSSK